MTVSSKAQGTSLSQRFRHWEKAARCDRLLPVFSPPPDGLLAGATSGWSVTRLES
jgi:hypothetical protein